MTIPVISAEDAAAPLNGSSTCAANRCCGFELMNGTHRQRIFRKSFLESKIRRNSGNEAAEASAFQVAQSLLRLAVSSGIIVRAVKKFAKNASKLITSVDNVMTAA